MASEIFSDYEEETRLQVSQTPNNLSYPWFLQPKNNLELPLRTRVPKGINSEVTCPKLAPKMPFNNRGLKRSSWTQTMMKSGQELAVRAS